LQPDYSCSVSGPSGTAGYVQVCIPKSLVSDASNLKITLDDDQINYSTFSKDDVWIITMIYSHSSYKVVLALNTEQTSGIGSIGNTLGNPLVLGLIIVVLIAVMAAVAIIIFSKGKVKTSANN
jgi:hypothetical protein